jgi:hypothetical protein
MLIYNGLQAYSGTAKSYFLTLFPVESGNLSRRPRAFLLGNFEQMFRPQKTLGVVISYLLLPDFVFSR